MQVEQTRVASSDCLRVGTIQHEVVHVPMDGFGSYHIGKGRNMLVTPYTSGPYA